MSRWTKNLLKESTNLVIAALLYSNQLFCLLCGTQVLRNAGLQAVEQTPSAVPWWWSPLCSILFISINTFSLPTWCIGLQMGHLVQLGSIEMDLWFVVIWAHYTWCRRWSRSLKYEMAPNVSKAQRSFKISGIMCQTIQHHIPEDFLYFSILCMSVGTKRSPLFRQLKSAHHWSLQWMNEPGSHHQFYHYPPISAWVKIIFE